MATPAWLVAWSFGLAHKLNDVDLGALRLAARMLVQHNRHNVVDKRLKDTLVSPERAPYPGALQDERRELPSSSPRRGCLDFAVLSLDSPRFTTGSSA